MSPMRHALTLHPDSSCEAVTLIEVDVVRPRPRALLLRYCVTGKPSELRLPPLTSSFRADELWRRTCFEAFVRGPGDDAYYEFNFAPSTQWAAYRFTGYRSGMSAPGEMAAPVIEVRSTERRFELQASLDLEPLTGLPGDGPWRLGLSTVIQEASGRISYWALAHPPGKPDFHHADGFAYEVPETPEPLNLERP